MSLPRVYFVGSGPGDPELLTLKAKRLLEAAEVVVYAGSLVSREVLELAAGAEKYNSYGMSLEELVALMAENARRGRLVLRLHSGDISIYSAAAEQARELRRLGIEVEFVPGVSSFQAAAARLGVEYTVPEVSQTVILTRAPGRTPVPEKERLAELARHRASMVIFLSAARAERVQRELLCAYPPETPVAVVYSVTTEEEKVVRCTLSELAESVERAGIKRRALILVGDFLKEHSTRSVLYGGS